MRFTFVCGEWLETVFLPGEWDWSSFIEGERVRKKDRETFEQVVVLFALATDWNPIMIVFMIFVQPRGINREEVGLTIVNKGSLGLQDKKDSF